MVGWGKDVSIGKPNRFGRVGCSAFALAVLVSAISLTASPPAMGYPSWQTTDLPAVVPGPPPPLSGPPVLNAESCPVVGSCVAVGTFAGGSPLAETLSDGVWSDTVLRTPGDGGAANLEAVTCTSATSCVAVGSYDTQVDFNQPIAEILTGTTWTATQLPLPFGDNGYGDFGLNAVSCTSSTWCVAVGTAEFADILNGTTWTSTTFPVSYKDPTSVSCVSIASCVAVLTGPDGPESATLSGSTWTESPLPAGSQASGISCTSVTSCVAVGGSGVDTLSGTTWTLSPVSFPAGAQTPSLSGVSCPSSSSCVAVGSYYLQGQDVNLPGEGVAETLSQGTWTDGPLASGGAAGVSCPTAVWCAEVGPLPLVRSGQWADVLSDGTWTNVQLPLPASIPYATLTGVSCPSPQSCTAVGSANEAVGNAVVPVAEHLSRGTWIASILPQPLSTGPNGGGPRAFLNAVSCPSAVLCVAVGSYFTPKNAEHPLAEVLTSGVWKAETLPWPSPDDGFNLDAISCLSSTSCVAVGNLVYTNNDLVETLSGRTWRAQLLPIHENQPFMTGVSCTLATSCVAVGFANGARPLAATLSGTTWSVQNLPTPYGDGDTQLEAVWCQSAASCVATGLSYVPIDRAIPISDELTGRRWTATNLPVVGSPDVTYLSSGLSCVSITSCVAVGGSDGLPFVESLTGVTWSPTTLALSPGDDGSILNSVSCPSRTFCVAVGQGIAPNGTYPFVATYGASGS